MKTFLSLLKTNYLVFVRDRLFFATTLLYPWAITAVLQIALGDPPSARYRYSFFCIIFCFWFFLNIAVRQIIQEKPVVKREFFAGLGKGTYLSAKFVFFFLVGFYVSAVFTMGMNAHLLDWESLNYLFNHGRKEWIHDRIDPGQFDMEEQRQLYEREQKRYDIQAEYRDIIDKPLTEFFFTYKNPRNDNPWGAILMREKDGWRWTTSGNDGTFFTDWGMHRDDSRLWHRVFQQLVQLALPDWGLVVLWLSCLAGLSLGLMISALSPTQEGAVQWVPYITIFQIIMSREVIGRDPDLAVHFKPLLNIGSATDILSWDFGSILSLATVSRYLEVMAHNLVTYSKAYKADWSYFFLDLGPDLAMVAAWIVLSYFICLAVLKNCHY